MSVLIGGRTFTVSGTGRTRTVLFLPAQIIHGTLFLLPLCPLLPLLETILCTVVFLI
uniref:Uncharacterized protein n=1 Tax=Setaria italica TaxID=4555 RepID=K3ZKY1_SETIT